MGSIRVHLRLAGDGANKRIHRRARRLMHMPPACAITHSNLSSPLLAAFFTAAFTPSVERKGIYVIVLWECEIRKEFDETMKNSVRNR